MSGATLPPRRAAANLSKAREDTRESSARIDRLLGLKPDLPPDDPLAPLDELRRGLEAVRHRPMDADVRFALDCAIATLREFIAPAGRLEREAGK